MGKIDTKILIKAINNSKDIETARRNLTSNNSDKTDYTTAATNITVVFADTLKSLKNILPVALYVNLVASYDKMTNDLNDDKSMKASNIVSFLGDITSMLTNSPFIPFNIKLTLYALSASLTAISWGISELEEYSEANEKEKTRLEALFKEYQEKLDKTWNTEAWNDPLCLLYEVKSTSAAENSGNLSFKIIFNKELDSDLTMSYYTLDDTAKQNKDYNGANDKKAILFTIPKGVNEYDLKVPIIDDNEKENDEEFMLVVDDSKANYAGKYILLGQPSAKGTIIDDENLLNADFSNSDKNDKFTNLQNIASNETASNSQNTQNGDFTNSQISRHSKRSEESQINLQNVNSQTSQNTLKMELTFTEKYVIKDFAHKLYGVKMPETKQRIGIDAATQCKISFLLDTISKHKRQIVQTCGEKTWQETFENFQKTNDLKVFENAVKSPLSQQNANLQISNENANLKNSRHSELSQESEESHKNLQNSAGNVNSENNATNLQNLDNDFKM